MNDVIQPAEPHSVLIETREGLVGRAHLPCQRCESYEWIYWLDGSRKVECHGCGRFIGYDVSATKGTKQGTGHRAQGAESTRDGPAALS